MYEHLSFVRFYYLKENSLCVRGVVTVSYARSMLLDHSIYKILVKLPQFKELKCIFNSPLASTWTLL